MILGHTYNEYMVLLPKSGMTARLEGSVWPVPSAPHWWCSCTRHSGRRPSYSPMEQVPSTSIVYPRDARASARVKDQYVHAQVAQQPVCVVSPLPMRDLSGTAIPFFSHLTCKQCTVTPPSFICLSMYCGSYCSTMPRTPVVIP
jgi:hypothetical protein